ncbi:MAG: MerR family transcriptional regulator [Luteitalea sp.]|nr:MerR family transcriptional regulator [Luteitalea sp.]
MLSSPTSAAYHIGELAGRSGLTRDTLRYYERLGLLSPVSRTSGGFRLYSPHTLGRLRFIKQAQALGLTLREVRNLVGYHDQGGLKRCRQVRDLLRTKMTDVEVKLAELEEFRTTLSAYLADCERTLDERGATRQTQSECPVIETLATGRRATGLGARGRRASLRE